MKYLVQEVTSSYSSFERFLAFLPNPAEELYAGNVADAIETFEEMLLDPHIHAKLQELKDIVLSANFRISPESEDQESLKVKEFVEDALKNLNLIKEVGELLTSLEYGYSVSEIIWENKDGYWIPKELKSRHPKRFRFNAKGELLYLEDGTFKPLNVPYKFIVHRHAPRAENPYGTSLLLRCYWPWRFKKAGLRFWLITAEKFSVPTILALFKTEGLSPEEIEERARLIADALSRIETDAALALANVEEVKTIEAKGSADDFKKLLEFCNMEISKAITGEVLTSDIGERGSYALSKVHENTLYARAKRIAKEIEETLNNTLIRYIVELNFGQNAPLPRISIEIEEIADWEKVKNAMAMGVPVSLKALYTKYGIPEPVDERDAFVNPKLRQGGVNFSDFFTKNQTRMRLKR